MKTSLRIAVVGLLVSLAPCVHAANIATTGGIILYSDGPTVAAASVPNNLALASNGATPFTLDELGFGIHFTSHLNDGVYGNSNSWIGNGATGTSGQAFAGVDLGGSFNVNSISFGRDATGGFNDRSVGAYTLQYRNDGSTADDAGWNSIGTITYSGSQNLPVTSSGVRHQFTFGSVDATAVRLLVPATGLGGGTAIDEIELFSGHATPVGLTLSQTGPAGPANSVPDNLALASNGAVAFAKDLIGNGAFAPTHTIGNLNDGVYGNANSWIGETDGTFAGVDLGGFFNIDSIAFGRDNTGAFGDRALGNITVQYTTVENPDAFTPNEDWLTLEVLAYDGVFPVSPALRHEFDLDTSIVASGIRLVTADGGLSGGVAIDELEVFGTAVPEPASVAMWILLGIVAVGFGWRRSHRHSVK